jgi:putative endonuclease
MPQQAVPPASRGSVSGAPVSGAPVSGTPVSGAPVSGASVPSASVPRTSVPRTSGSGRAGTRDRGALGRWGEDLAVQHLTAAGLDVLDRNWRCREGELDVVARETDGTVVFVEVKTRSTGAFGQPSEAVSYAKAARIRTLACRWLLQHPSGGVPLRFDVVSVVAAPGRAPQVHHLRSAF